MAAIIKDLPIPKEVIQTYINEFDSEQQDVELALTKLFESFPTNTASDEVLLKAAALNTLYATNIYDIFTMAQSIYKQGVELDTRLATNDPSAVMLIAKAIFKSKRKLQEKERNNYSFASKYCAWHRPADYPIYDFYVRWLLCRYRDRDHFATFYDYELETYPRFKEVFLVFQQYYDLSQYSLKAIDKFLWVFGKQLYDRLEKVKRKEKERLSAVET